VKDAADVNDRRRPRGKVAQPATNKQVMPELRADDGTERHLVEKAHGPGVGAAAEAAEDLVDARKREKRCPP
jgi:hypothetical protein